MPNTDTTPVTPGSGQGKTPGGTLWARYITPDRHTCVRAVWANMGDGIWVGWVNIIHDGAVVSGWPSGTPMTARALAGYVPAS